MTLVVTGNFDKLLGAVLQAANNPSGVPGPYPLQWVRTGRF